MENNEVYCYFGTILFKSDINGNDFWINPKFHDSWQEVEFEHGPHPCVNFPKLTREQALQFAMKLGMSEQAFNQ